MLCCHELQDLLPVCTGPRRFHAHLVKPAGRAAAVPGVLGQPAAGPSCWLQRPRDVVSFHWGGLWDDSQEDEGRKGKVMATVTDPVCGMEIDSVVAAASEEYQGKTYYFCSEGCHQRFVAAPEQYAV
jgi:YHS domain-containing protein